MKKYLFLIFILVQLGTLHAQDFKVVGYLPYYRFELVDQIDFTKITHLNLAFLNPDINGNLSIGDQNIDLITAFAKTQNPELQIYISLAGGGITEEWEQAYNKFLLPEYRPEFAHRLVEYVQRHNLDGIDVDLEWNMVNEHYSPFVMLLADSLKKHGKNISAALPGTYRYPEIDDEVLVAYDFINLMAYDLTGPWRPNDPGPHSPREFAEQSISYWRNEGLPDNKIVLGVPFYGYDFTNQSNVYAFTFGSLINENEHYAYIDQVGEKYYNGISTIQYKTLLALNEELAGIMIWELGQDAFQDDYGFSLLSAIDYVIETGMVLITGIEYPVSAQAKIFPNPFHDVLAISLPGNHSASTFRIFDLQGREHRYCQSHSTNNTHFLDYSNLNSGLYIFEYFNNGKTHRKKVMKIN